MTQKSAVHTLGLIVNRESAIGNRQSAIGNRQSAIGNRQSAIGNRQSAIGNFSLATTFNLSTFQRSPLPASPVGEEKYSLALKFNLLIFQPLYILLSLTSCFLYQRYQLYQPYQLPSLFS
jgi:hypothetical protein